MTPNSQKNGPDLLNFRIYSRVLCQRKVRFPPLFEAISYTEESSCVFVLCFVLSERWINQPSVFLVNLTTVLDTVNLLAGSVPKYVENWACFRL